MKSQPAPFKKKIILSIISGASGFALWNFYAANQIVVRSLTIPTYLYNQKKNGLYEAPEHICISVEGSRRNLAAIDVTKNGIFLDCCNCKPGDTIISIGTENLFLPQELKLLHYTPLPVCISYSQSNTQETAT